MARETNIEFVTRLMSFSKSGAFAQAFVMTALEKYSSSILRNREGVLAQMAGDLVSGEAWIQCAEEIHQELRNRDEEGNPDKRCDCGAVTMVGLKLCEKCYENALLYAASGGTSNETPSGSE